MSVSLVKTIGGSHGAPQKCSRCDSEHFIRSGLAWSCGSCGNYIPARLEKNKTIQSLKADISKLQNLHGELQGMIAEVENLIKKS